MGESDKSLDKSSMQMEEIEERVEAVDKISINTVNMIHLCSGHTVFVLSFLCSLQLCSCMVLSHLHEEATFDPKDYPFSCWRGYNTGSRR